MTSNLELPFGSDGLAAGTEDDDLARLAAVDPTRNVALAASAGTGKTHVLVDRYVNLLRAGVDPVHILAITFTRKAAAEMRQRILDTMREAAARGELPAGRWRELKDRIGDIAISTIDAFCLSLLREFPLEADLDPGFDVAEETEIPRLVEESLDRTLRTCRSLAREDEDMALAFVGLGERRLRQGLSALLDRRLVAEDILRRSLAHGPKDLTSTEAARRVVDGLKNDLLGVPGGLRAFLDDGPRAHPQFALLASEVEVLCGLHPAGAGAGPLAEPARVRALVEAIRAHFFTLDNKPRQKLTYAAGEYPSAASAKRHREAVQFLAPAIGASIDAFRRDLNVVMSRGIWRVFQIAVADYQRTLNGRGVLDFAGLLGRAIDLLKRMDEFARSRYLLESRFHHVLVDEFQDTSRAQWELVTLLIRAWREGAGVADAAPLPPSIFIVGDMKQSIYGFRDADVAMFNRAAGFIDRLRPGTRSRRTISRNFRSVPEILAFVNDLFGAMDVLDDREDAFAFGVADRFPVEDFTHDGEPSLGLAVANDIETSAELVSVELERLLRDQITIRDRVSGVRRVVRPADIAILFRSRESHREFEAALDRRGIPAYVYKGLGFFDADEIKDVLALLRWLAHPTSNLRTAAFLRSRLVRLSDPAIHALSPELASALLSDDAPPAAGDLQEEDQRVLERARVSAREWLAQVDLVPPVDLLERVLDESAYAFETAGPRRAQARENLKKIRGLVRRIQNRGYATIARIADHLDRLSAGDESNAVVDAMDAVNLMTVHAAKGLEFPIVFLVSLAKGTSGRRSPIRVAEPPSRSSDPAGDDQEAQEAHVGGSVAIGDFLSEADEDAVIRAREETKRLLYVAVTRARDRLYLSSVLKDDKLMPARGSLAEVLPPSARVLLEQAAARTGRTIEWNPSGGGCHVFHVCGFDAIRDGSLSQEKSELPPRSVADDFDPLVDDGADERVSVVLQIGLEGRDAPPDEERLLAGTLVHRLLQAVGPRAIAESAEISPGRVASLLRPEELPLVTDMDALVASVVALFRRLAANPRVSDLAARGRWSYEVPFSIRRSEPTPIVLRGTIDCLVQHGKGSVTVLEFKTGRPMAEHDRQLDIYVEAVRSMFPGAPIDGLVVYPD